ncbi:MAG: proprotein convertase P-domain-containing protein, partial [Caldilineaceae bacterium]
MTTITPLLKTVSLNTRRFKPTPLRWLALRALTPVIALLTILFMVAPLRAESFVYDDAPPTAIAFDEVSTSLCNEPLYRPFVVNDSFTVNDIDLGFTADHSYRSDIRLVLESPKGTRVEVVVEFDMTPEDADANYDILIDDDVTDLLDNDVSDNTGAPYYTRRVHPTNPFTPFYNEQAKGTWILEVCDAGVEDSGAYQRSRLVFDGTPLAAGPLPNTISGLLFRDYNADGAYTVRAEGGVPNITVTAYDDAGQILDRVLTDAAGEFSLTVPNGRSARLEFHGLPDYLQPGPAGPDSATTVTFVTSPAADVRVGLANPGQHAQNPGTMQVALPRYTYGANNGPNSTMETLVSYREEDGSHALLTGDNVDTSVYDGTSKVLARQNQTGSIWGLAYDRLHDQLLGAAFVKRHSGLGVTGNPTTIYRFDPNTQGAVEWLTLDPTSPDPHGSNVTWFEDFSVYAAVGKVGWGDIDISDDLQTLYGIELTTRRLMVIPIQADGSAGIPTGVEILPALRATLVGTNEGQCPTLDDLRPFGLGINDGTVYLGLVCTAESTV